MVNGLRILREMTRVKQWFYVESAHNLIKDCSYGLKKLGKLTNWTIWPKRLLDSFENRVIWSASNVVDEKLEFKWHFLQIQTPQFDEVLSYMCRISDQIRWLGVEICLTRYKWWIISLGSRLLLRLQLGWSTQKTEVQGFSIEPHLIAR